MALTVKGAAASRHQQEMGKLIVTTTKARGGDDESCAGAVATSIQESGLTNINHGDRDSLGLYQQRPSMGWGSPGQVTTPSYAIGKFLDQFLAYRKKGYGWLQASHKTQRSAYPSAPARWYSEGRAFTAAFVGSGSTVGSTAAAGDGSAADGSGSYSYQVTREEPYEFSRGSADKEESTWECSGRLADEVQWRRFMRGGALWYVSETWLARQPPIARLNEFTAGVVSFGFEFETRTDPAEASLKVAARRYAFLPGDVVDVFDEGPGSGRWLVKGVRRNLHSQVSEIALARRRQALPEPAPTVKTETITVQGTSVGGAQQTSAAGVVGGQSADGTPQAVQTAYAKAIEIHDRGYPYVWGGGHGAAGVPNGGGYDCSGSTVAVLAAANLGFRQGGGTAVSGTLARWGQAGPGKYFTIYANGEHVWIRWNGVGNAWRFDTSPYGCGGRGPRQRQCARPTSGFAARHWPGL